MTFRRVSLVRLLTVVAALAAVVSTIPFAGASPDLERRGRGIVSFGESLTVSEPVDGNLQMLGGSLQLDAAVTGDVIVIGTAVKLGEQARISGDLVAFASQIERHAGSQVGGRVIEPFSTKGAFHDLAPGEAILGDIDGRFALLLAAFKISLLVVWLVAAVVITIAAGREVRTSSVELRASPFHTFTVGLVAYTSFILTAIVFSYLIPYVVGIPLLIALGVFAIGTKVYGMIAVFHAVGALMFGPRKADEVGRRRFRGDLTMVVAGLVVLGLVRMIPVIGPLVWMAASLVGVGTALATKFGRREPWFLAWREAPA